MIISEDFFQAIQDMRLKQKQYFASRNPIVLAEAKKNEKLVDNYINYYLDNKLQEDLWKN
jgi:glycosylphosphatidylinositol transamidase (GPIT) subunit GPI8